MTVPTHVPVIDVGAFGLGGQLLAPASANSTMTGGVTKRRSALNMESPLSLALAPTCGGNLVMVRAEQERHDHRRRGLAWEDHATLPAHFDGRTDDQRADEGDAPDGYLAR